MIIIIDFDWCGKARYPASASPNTLISRRMGPDPIMVKEQWSLHHDICGLKIGTYFVYSIVKMTR
jgi:hypothetical protein